MSGLGLSKLLDACTCTGVKITVGHRLKTDQFSKKAAHFLVWYDIFQIKEGWVYTVVRTCAVNVADITFWAFGNSGNGKLK